MEKINNYGFLASNCVKVFPCAYRGYQIDGTTIFDPESKLNTESTLTKNGSSISDLATSYILSWTPSLLRCVLAGYTFELNVGPQDFDIPGFANKDIYIKIVVEQRDLIDHDHKTTVLRNQSFIEDSDLDNPLDGPANEYYFTGLIFIPCEPDTIDKVLNADGTISEGVYTLRILKADGNPDKANFLPHIASGTGDDSVILNRRMVNPQNNPDEPKESNILDTQNIIIGDRSTAVNSGIIMGNNSIAANSSNVLNDSAAGFGGSYVSGKQAFAANGASASATNSAAFGLATANKENQFAAGVYNDLTADTLLSIGNGTKTKAHNALEVNQAGEINFYTDNKSDDTKYGIAFKALSEYDNSNKRTNIDLKTIYFTRDAQGTKTTIKSGYPIISSDTNTFADGVFKANAANNFVLGTNNTLSANSKNAYLLGKNLNNNNVSDILLVGTDNKDLIPNTAFAVSNGKNSAVPFSISATKDSKLAVKTLDCLEYDDLKNSFTHDGFDLAGHTLSDIQIKGGMDTNGEMMSDYFSTSFIESLKELRWTAHPITGIKTPALYFNDDQEYPDTVDYAVPYFLYDTIKIDDVLYNRWVKSPVEELTDPEYYLGSYEHYTAHYLLTNKVADVYAEPRQVSRFTDALTNKYIVVSSEYTTKTAFKVKGSLDTLFGYECQRINSSDESIDKSDFSICYCTTLDPNNITGTKVYRKLDSESTAGSIVVELISTVKTINDTNLITHIDDKLIRTGKVLTGLVNANIAVKSPYISGYAIDADNIHSSDARFGNINTYTLVARSEVDTNEIVTSNKCLEVQAETLNLRHRANGWGLCIKQVGDSATKQSTQFYVNTTPSSIAGSPALELTYDGMVKGDFIGNLRGQASEAAILSNRGASGTNKIPEWYTWHGNYAAVLLQYTPDEGEHLAKTYCFGIGYCGWQFSGTVINEIGTIWNICIQRDGSFEVKQAFDYNFSNLKTTSLSGSYSLYIFKIHD